MNRATIRLRFVVAALVLAGALSTAAEAADALPTLHADPTKTSVSGLSSGAFMAVQYAVAYSASVAGVAVVAGGPFDCAPDHFGDVAACMTGSPSGSQAWGDAKTFESFGQIDPVAGIAKQRVYLFSGTKDSVVLPRVVAATRDFYRAAGVPASAISFVGKVPAGHAFLAPSFGNACGSGTSPYVERCVVGARAYDQPRAILRHLHGPLAAPATTLSATVRPFDQREFASAATSLDSAGFVYIPKACANGGAACSVHVVFHGCLQGAQSVGGAVYGHAGFNRWADANRIIVLYPQVVRSAVFPYNPDGCWDWWGAVGPLFYTGPTFMVRSGVQLSAVKAMVDRLTAP